METRFVVSKSVWGIWQGKINNEYNNEIYSMHTVCLLTLPTHTATAPLWRWWRQRCIRRSLPRPILAQVPLLSFLKRSKQTQSQVYLKIPSIKADTTIYYQHNVQTKCPSRRSSILHIIKPQAVYTRLYYVSFITAFYVRTFILYLNWGLDFLTNNWQKTDNSNLTHTNISYISVKNNKSLRGICSSF